MPRRASLSIHPRRTLDSSRISVFFSSPRSLRLCDLCVNVFFVFFLFLALATVSLSGCSSRNQSDPSSLTFLIESSPTNLDPRFATDSQSQRIDGLLFSGLLERDNQMKFHGDLAESWSTPDPLTYVFHLRRGVRFHDDSVRIRHQVCVGRQLEEIRVAVALQRELLDLELGRLGALLRFGSESRSRHGAQNTPRMQASMRHCGAC